MSPGRPERSSGPDARGMPLVSVVIPTYGRAEAVTGAVESVVDQTYEAIELIVVDDASPQPVEPALAPVVADAKLPITVIRHEENRGANAARNSGIEAASGAYVAFLDDDDRWLPESVHRRAEVLDSNPDVGVVFSEARNVDEGGHVLYETRSSVEGDATGALLRGGIVGSFSRVMVRTAVIERAGLPDERFPSWQDWEWYIRLSEHCAFERVADTLTVRQVSDDRISGDHEAKRDVSYPLMVEKHGPTAARYGWVVERQFRAACARSLAASALANGYWRDAVWYAVTAVRRYPLSARSLVYLGLALAGPHALPSARAVRRALANAGTSR